MEVGDEVPLRFHWPKYVDLKVNNLPHRWDAGMPRCFLWLRMVVGGAKEELVLVCWSRAPCRSGVLPNPQTGCRAAACAGTSPAVPPALAAARDALCCENCRRPYGRALNSKMGINQRDDVASIGV